MELKKLPKIALGAWAWGNDGTFGGSLSADDLRPVFEAGMKAGLNLWIQLMPMAWERPKESLETL